MRIWLRAAGATVLGIGLLTATKVALPGGNAQAASRATCADYVTLMLHARRRNCGYASAQRRRNRFDWCLRVSEVQARRAVNQLDRQIKICEQSNKLDRSRAKRTASPAFCRVQSARIVKAIQYARARGCRVNRPPRLPRIVGQCLSRSPRSTNGLLAKWTTYARTCRPVR